MCSCLALAVGHLVRGFRDVCFKLLVFLVLSLFLLSPNAHTNHLCPLIFLFPF